MGDRRSWTNQGRDLHRVVAAYTEFHCQLCQKLGTTLRPIPATCRQRLWAWARLVAIARVGHCAVARPSRQC